MSLHVTCLLMEGERPLADQLVFSEVIAASGSVSSNAVPADGKPYCLHLVSEADMFVSVGAAPDATAAPRILLLSGKDMIVRVRPGSRVSWVTQA